MTDAAFDLQTERMYGDRMNRSGPTAHVCCPDNLKDHDSTARCQSAGGQQRHAQYADAVRRGDGRMVALLRADWPCCPSGICPECKEPWTNGRHEIEQRICHLAEAYWADMH